MQTRRKFLTAVSVTGIMSLLPFKMAWPFTKVENEENIQIWTTAKGKRIRIIDLTDDHLRNIIFYMNKAYGYVHPEGIMGGSPADIPGLYDALRREANRRKLSWI